MTCTQRKWMEFVILGVPFFAYGLLSQIDGPWSLIPCFLFGMAASRAVSKMKE